MTKLLVVGGKEPGSPDALVSAAADGTIAYWQPSMSAAGSPFAEPVNPGILCELETLPRAPVRLKSLSLLSLQLISQIVFLQCELQHVKSLLGHTSQKAAATGFLGIRSLSCKWLILFWHAGAAGKEINPIATVKPHDAEITSLILSKSSPSSLGQTSAPVHLVSSGLSSIST